MEVEGRRQVEQGRSPDRLIGPIAPAGHGFHVVEDEYPGHPAQRAQAGDEASDQSLLAHIRGPADPTPATVLEPTGQEVARSRRRLGEREVAHLAPVDLQVLTGQALETDR